MRKQSIIESKKLALLYSSSKVGLDTDYRYIATNTHTHTHRKCKILGCTLVESLAVCREQMRLKGARGADFGSVQQSRRSSRVIIAHKY